MLKRTVFTVAALTVAMIALTVAQQRPAPVKSVRLYVFENGAIRGLDPKLFNFTRQELKEVDFTPLCSPVLLNKVTSLADPADLARACLLHLVDDTDWENWLTVAGVDPALARSGITFSDMNLVYSAAMAAQGVAMGDEFICRGAMANGALVRPFDIKIKSKNAYYLVVSDAKADTSSVRAFTAWLKEEVMKNDAGPMAG